MPLKWLAVTIVLTIGALPGGNHLVEKMMAKMLPSAGYLGPTP